MSFERVPVVAAIDASPLQPAAQRGLERTRIKRAKRPNWAGLVPAFPGALTAGESRTDPTLQKNQGVKVDWVTLTFLPSPDELVDRTFFDFLNTHLSRPIFAVSVSGMLGYEFGVKFFCKLDDGKEHHIARLDWGGAMHKSRARFDLSGSGCSLVKSWPAFQDYVGALFNYTLTRVDLAADFLNGEYSVEDARIWYESGLFNAGGRMPRHNLVGDWLKPVYGRTLEIGRRENGKMLRCYEKGRQLGDPSSLWTRFEVELRNIDRDLPLNILTECSNFFVGSYKCLEQIVEAAVERIKTQQKEGEISLEKLTDCARDSYGRLISVLALYLSPDEIIETLSRPGVPARLEKATLIGVLQKGTCSPAFLSGEKS